MALAINTLAEMGGGQIAVKDGEAVAAIPLPIAGCLADVPPEEMAEQERRLTDVIHAWGCLMDRPLFFLMFLEIVPLPFYALTEHGMVDFLSLQYMHPVLERVA